MKETKVLVCWRETPSRVAVLDKLAEERSIDRSDVLRMMCRGQIQITVDSADKK